MGCTSERNDHGGNQEMDERRPVRKHLHPLGRLTKSTASALWSRRLGPQWVIAHPCLTGFLTSAEDGLHRLDAFRKRSGDLHDVPVTSQEVDPFHLEVAELARSRLALDHHLPAHPKHGEVWMA